MKNPAEALCEVVAGIDNNKNANHVNVTSILPILDCKEANVHVNVTGAFGGVMVLDDLDCGLVVLVDRCRTILRESSLARTAQRQQACFPAVTAAMNDASVEQVAVRDCVSEW